MCTLDVLLLFYLFIYLWGIAQITWRDGHFKLRAKFNLIGAVYQNQLPPGARCPQLWGWNMLTPFTVCKGEGMGSSTRILAGRAECTTFLILSALHRGTSVMTVYWAHTLQLTALELQSSEIDCLATNMNLMVVFILFLQKEVRIFFTETSTDKVLLHHEEGISGQGGCCCHMAGNWLHF